MKPARAAVLPEIKGLKIINREGDMNDSSKQIFFNFSVKFFNRDTAEVIFASPPRGIKAEIKYAEPSNPKRLLTFNQLKEIISKKTYYRGKRSTFYIVNEKTQQMEEKVIPIPWIQAPIEGDKMRGIRKVEIDITNEIKKLEGE